MTEIPRDEQPTKLKTWRAIQKNAENEQALKMLQLEIRNFLQGFLICTVQENKYFSKSFSLINLNSLLIETHKTKGISYKKLIKDWRSYPELATWGTAQRPDDPYTIAESMLRGKIGISTRLSGRFLHNVIDTPLRVGNETFTVTELAAEKFIDVITDPKFAGFDTFCSELLDIVKNLTQANPEKTEYFITALKRAYNKELYGKSKRKRNPFFQREPRAEKSSAPRSRGSARVHEGAQGRLNEARERMRARDKIGPEKVRIEVPRFRY